jgi:WD40 repeat protein
VQKGKVLCVAYSPDGRWLAAGGSSRFVRVWDTGSWACVRELPHAHGKVTAVTFHPDGGLLAVGGSLVIGRPPGRPVTLWDVTAGAVRRILGGWSETIATLAFTPDGSRLYACRWQGGSRAPGGCGYWTLGGKKVRFVDTRESGVNALAVSPAGDYVAEAVAVPGVWVQRIDSKVPHLVTLNPRWANALAVRPDGKRIAAGHGIKVTLFTPFDGDGDPTELNGHTDKVMAVAFAPDGLTLASGGKDSLLVLWDAAAGAELRRLALGVGPVNGLAFAPDGLTLATAGDRGLVVVDVG